jgi:hypothetical protein
MADDKYDILQALAEMYERYCGHELGHECAHPGEQALDILRRYDVIGPTNGWGGEGRIDYEKIKALKTA